MTDRDRIEDAAFDVWQAVEAADFHILLAYKHGGAAALAEARKHLLRALYRIDAALPLVIDTNVTPDEPGEMERDEDGIVWEAAE